MEEKSNLLSEHVAKSANNLEGKSEVAKRTCSVIKQVRVDSDSVAPVYHQVKY